MKPDKNAVEEFHRKMEEIEGTHRKNMRRIRFQEFTMYLLIALGILFYIFAPLVMKWIKEGL